MSQTLASSEVIAWSVDTLLSKRPMAANALIKLRLGCVGCQLADFHTLGDVAAIYGIAPGQLLQAIETSISTESLSGESPPTT